MCLSVQSKQTVGQVFVLFEVWSIKEYDAGGDGNKVEYWQVTGWGYWIMGV